MKAKLGVLLLLLPALGLIAGFLIALTSVLVMSVLDSSGALSLESYRSFLGDERNLTILFQSIWIAFYVTVICLLLGYPIAIAMSRSSRTVASLITLALAIQFFSIYVVKMYGWMLILGNNGVINRMLLGSGIVSSPVKLMYNELGVAIGLTAAALPLMVFPINAVLQTISLRYEEAALGLGAGRLRALLSITLPLSVPGILSGVILTFVFCFAAYLTPGLLGGGFFKMIGNVIYEQAVARFNYSFAAAAAVITLLISLIAIVGVNKASQVLAGGRQ
ncbi:MAG: ABC transporter permease [Xanthobacteraceae bacterium]|nr:ABC transporter permease [Xanthobacteraceae bacterium]MBX3550407.1 ABC transporter permease [Xanthobacteraceae bacterium]MCW5676961.1 ABC transporter permease [Xanthobacteraceae bacterium]